MSCAYKNQFGEPGTGVHSYRIFDIAVVDLGLTIIVALILSWLFKWNFLTVLLILIVLGIILHRMFCVNTTVNKLIFGTV